MKLDFAYAVCLLVAMCASPEYAEPGPEPVLKLKGPHGASDRESLYDTEAPVSIHEARLLLRRLCGPVAAYYALNLYGSNTPTLSKVLEYFDTDDVAHGTSLASIQAALAKGGLDSTAMRSSGELRDIWLPAIVHLDKPEGHFDLVLFRRGDTFAVVDADHLEFVNLTDIRSRMSGYLLHLDTSVTRSNVLLRHGPGLDSIAVVVLATIGIGAYAIFLLRRMAKRQPD